MSVFSGLSRPLKAAGLALIGLAVIAGVIGGVTALTGGESNDTAQPPPSSQAPPPAASSPAPSSPAPATSAPPSSSAAPSPTPSAPPPSSTVPGGAQPNPGGQPGGPQQVAKWVTVRVYNNSTIHGLAARAADDFKASGWNVAEVSNYSAGIIPATTAYFRPGTDEETAARALAAEFGMRAEPRFEGIQQSSPGVIVIVTNNYQVAKGK